MMDKSKVSKLSGFGSIPRSRIRATFDDKGTRLVNGRQVNLLIAMGLEVGLSDDKLLEFLEFECDAKVTKLEDVADGAMLSRIVTKLKEQQSKW
jgi:hypothetical protein